MADSTSRLVCVLCHASVKGAAAGCMYDPVLLLSVHCELALYALVLGTLSLPETLVQL